MNQVQLPEEVVTEIPVRLPVKSLLRFCCVSKIWAALINSPYFVDMHLNSAKNRNNDVVLVKRFIEDENRTLLSFHRSDPDWQHGDGVSLPDFMKLYGKFNGIICFASFLFRKPIYYPYGEKIHLRDKICSCNPATRQFLQVPPRPFVFTNAYSGFLMVSLGFGFEPSTKDYKVARYLSYYSTDGNDNNHLEFEIYNLRTNSWRKLDFPPPTIPYPIPLQIVSVSLNGSLFWSADSYLDQWRMILSFNMCNDAFEEIEYPCDIPFHARADVALLDDFLALIVTAKQLPPSESDRPYTREISIDIWVMMEHGIKESWIKKLSIMPLSLKITPILHSRNGEILLLNIDNDGRLISLPLQNNYCEQIWKYDNDSLEAIAYKETLVSLEGIGDGLSWRKM